FTRLGNPGQMVEAARVAVVRLGVGGHPDGDRGHAVRRAHVPVDPRLGAATLAIAEEAQEDVIEGTGTVKIRHREIDVVNPSAHDPAPDCTLTLWPARCPSRQGRCRAGEWASGARERPGPPRV